MKKTIRSRPLMLRTAAAVVAASLISPLAAVAQEYARIAPDAETSILDASPVQPDARTARPVEVKQPSYRFGYVEYEFNDAGEQPVMQGFDWRDPATGLIMGYDD